MCSVLGEYTTNRGLASGGRVMHPPQAAKSNVWQNGEQMYMLNEKLQFFVLNSFF
jgi:hypothetical protein